MFYSCLILAKDVSSFSCTTVLQWLWTCNLMLKEPKRMENKTLWLENNRYWQNDKQAIIVFFNISRWCRNLHIKATIKVTIQFLKIGRKKVWDSGPLKMYLWPVGPSTFWTCHKMQTQVVCVGQNIILRDKLEYFVEMTQ